MLGGWRPPGGAGAPLSSCRCRGKSAGRSRPAGPCRPPGNSGHGPGDRGSPAVTAHRYRT